MEICLLKEGEYREQIAQLLSDVFPNSYCGCALEQADKLLSAGRVALGALQEGHMLGFVGAIPQYGTTGWELHPLMVRKDWRKRGIGSALVRALEREAAARGAITLYLGADDEEGKTSLANVDLYRNTFEKIARIQNYNQHPYEFYLKQGYQIVGVFPDVNGLGKPDIWMAKKIQTQY